MTVTYKEYTAEKQAFVEKHGSSDWKVSTSQMDEYGRYCKTYIFGDSAIWYELMSPETETATFTHRGIEFKQDVKMMRIEFWSTESGSKYYYEKW